MIGYCANRQTATCIVVPLKEATTCHILYRNRPNDIQLGLQGSWCLQNSLQDYFTAKCDILILRVRLKVGFYSHEYQLTRIPYTVLSCQNKLVGCPLGVPISYNRNVRCAMVMDLAVLILTCLLYLIYDLY